MSQETETEGHRQVPLGIDIPLSSRHKLSRPSLPFFRCSVRHNMFYSQLFWVGLYTPIFCLPTIAVARLSPRLPRLRPAPAAISIRSGRLNAMTRF